MNNNVKYGLMAISFIITITCGYFIGHALKPSSGESEEGKEIAIVDNDGHQSKVSDRNNPHSPVSNTIPDMESSSIKEPPMLVNSSEGKKEEPNTKEKQPKEEKKGISGAEFQSHLLNLGDRSLDPGKGMVSRKLVIRVVGMNKSEENRPSDIEGVRRKISFGTWKSATVVGEPSYDAQGLVISVTIRPVYNDKEMEE